MLNVANLPGEILAYTPAADMRKGIDGLSGIVRQELGSDPTDGSLFLFINRRRDRMKLLHFDQGGYWLYYRVLEAGTFESLHADDSTSHGGNRLQIDATELAMLLSGVKLAAASNRRKRYVKPTAEKAA